MNERKIKKMLNGKRTVAVPCGQFGDSGKGKVVDLLGDWADITARGAGGDNAGHTMVAKGLKIISHLVPCGILRDAEGKVNVIGSGVVFNPRVALEELNLLTAAGITHNNLKISLFAKLTLPQHILLDRVKESDAGKGKIGTTGRGIGPVYTDHYARVGLIVNDLLNRDIFVEKLRRNLKEKIKLLRLYDPKLVMQVMQHPHLENGIFYHPEHIIDVDAVVERYCQYGVMLKEMVCDADEYMRQNVGIKNILLEGSQGLMLSVDKGNYPNVTSSDSSPQGLVRGVGLEDSDLDLTLTVLKAFYMTRVGNGPLPTEFGGNDSAEWCGTYTEKLGINREKEKQLVPEASVNDPDPFRQGIAIRQEGDEYGATTGRPRRPGWFDLPMTRYAKKHCGPNVVLTKLDVLSSCETIKICVEYIFDGPDYHYGDTTIKRGDRLEVAIPYNDVLKHCKPVYKEFPGWMCDIRGARTLKELPAKLLNIFDYVKDATHIEPQILSVSPDREKTIIL